MSKYDSYMNRLEQYGQTDTDLISYSTIQNINSLFNGSPYYQSLSINGVSTDTRLLRGKDAYSKVLTFRPSQSIQLGSYVTIGDENWIITSFDNHPFYPKSDIQRCNFVMKWNDVDGNLKQYPCVAKATTKRISESDGSTFLVTNIPMTLLVQENEDTISIRKGLRIILNQQPLEIIGIDALTEYYGSSGMIQFGLVVTNQVDGDDLVNSIADNSVYYQPSTSGNGSDTIGW